MALSNLTLAPIVPPSSSSSCCCFFTRSSSYCEVSGFETLIKSNGYRFPTVRSRFQSGAIDTRGVGIVENNNNAALSSSPSSSVVGNAVVDIPVTCYQLIGVSSQAEKDEIVKSVMNLKGSEVDDGYTSDVVVSRQVRRSKKSFFFVFLKFFYCFSVVSLFIVGDSDGCEG